MSILFALSAGVMMLVLVIGAVYHWFLDLRHDYRPVSRPVEPFDHRLVKRCSIEERLSWVDKQLKERKHDEIVQKLRSEHRRMIEERVERVRAARKNETHEDKLCREAYIESMAWAAEQDRKDLELWASIPWENLPAPRPERRPVHFDIPTLVDRVRMGYRFACDYCVW